MMNRFYSNAVALFAMVLLAGPGYAGDSDLYGVWETTEYQVDGATKTLKGLMVITPSYFLTNSVYDDDGDGRLEANANSGPITVKDGTIEYLQWMQLHYRPSGEGEFLKENVAYTIKYTIEGDLLIFHLPSGNKYISRRLAGLQE